jgi:hypothetical protein
MRVHAPAIDGPRWRLDPSPALARAGRVDPFGGLMWPAIGARHATRRRAVANQPLPPVGEVTPPVGEVTPPVGEVTPPVGEAMPSVRIGGSSPVTGTPDDDCSGGGAARSRRFRPLQAAATSLPPTEAIVKAATTANSNKPIWASRSGMIEFSNRTDGR